jgi:hypothetical protein
VSCSPGTTPSESAFDEASMAFSLLNTICSLAAGQKIVPLLRVSINRDQWSLGFKCLHSTYQAMIFMGGDLLLINLEMGLVKTQRMGLLVSS